MKKLYLLIAILFFTIGLKAQVLKSVEATPGNLHLLLSANELSTVTDLTITGIMDARDFRVIRDEMPQLVNLDIRQVTIFGYSGEGGTFPTEYGYNYAYAANTVPFAAFAGFVQGVTQSLQSVLIPLNTLAIGQSAFAECKAMTSFTIPSSVTTIEQSAFYDCSGLTSITIPSSVTFLGWSAFKGCSSLKTMIIPPSVTLITEQLFMNCSALTSVELPSTVTILEKWAFAGCSSLVSLNLPEGVTSIGALAFEKCFSLESLTIPGSVTFIGESAFDGCNNWKGSLQLPQGLKKIQAYTFRQCSSLSSVQLPAALDSIGTAAFEDCIGLSGPLSLPSTLKLIGTRAFNNCSQLTGTLTFPETLASIGSRAFENCSGLTGELILPPLVNTVEEHSFAGCSGFSSLTIPANVQFINSGAFSGCSRLIAINAQSVQPVPLNDVTEVFEGVDKTTTTLHVPFGSKEAYTTAEGWKEFTNIIETTQGFLLSATALNFSPEGGSNSTINLKASVAWTALSDQAWLSVSPSSGNNSQILTLTAEANPTEVFRKATVTITAQGVVSQAVHITQQPNPVVIQSIAGHLKEIMTEEQRQTITRLIITGTMNAPDFGFISDMPLLAELDLSGVTITSYYETIMRYDFYFPGNTIPGYSGGYSNNYSLRNMTTLISIILPSTTKRIGSNAFEGCNSLKNIEIPTSVIFIGEYAFKDCKALTTCKIPSSVVELGYEIFSGCSRLAVVELPEGIITLAGGTFKDCFSLRNIQLPASLKDIGSETFSGCRSLTRIELPPLVTTIGYRTFSGCTALSSVSMPPSLISIGHQAFLGCIELTTITIPSQVNFIAPAAFGECRYLETIYAYPVRPPQKEDTGYEDAFTNVDKVNCLVYVPLGSRELYTQAEDWKGFNHILEMETFRLSVNYLTMGSISGTASTEVTSTSSWTATSDEPWLTITPASGAGSSTVTISLTANLTAYQRMAVVTFTSGNQIPQTITVVQQGNIAAIELTAGNLNSTFTAVELKGIERLTIKGTMDARDFKTIRDKMISLTELDVSEVTIIAYSGTEGTLNSQYYTSGDTLVESFDYPSNEVPAMAFAGNCKQITSVKLPTSTTSIGNNAFSNRTLLTAVAIPSTVTYIGSGAFAQCISLTSITLPPRITQIKESLFENSGLTSITIPSTVISIEHIAFANCDSLTSIHSNALYPPELTWQYGNSQAFFHLDKSKCTLYVPYGSMEAYAAAPNEWKEFTNVVEMPGFRPSAVTVAVKAAQDSKAKVGITSDVQWTASSDQSWLTVNPSSETGTDSLTFTAQANTMDAGRMATVTLSAPDVISQTITVIQEGKPRIINLTPGTMAYVFTPEEMIGITNLTITGVMDVRDFRIMRDQMPLLTMLDLSQVKIAEFQETDKLTGKPFVYRVNQVPDSAFFDRKNWKGKTSLTTVIFPITLEKIGVRAFSHAEGLTALRLPFTMRYVETNAFNFCPYLKAIYSYALLPPPSHVWEIGFYNVDKNNCILYVPFGSKAMYAESQWWKDFKNIVEMEEFKIMTTKAILKATQDSVRMRIQSQVPWTAETTEQWLTVNPASGNDDQVITITAQANPSENLRTGTVTFKAEGYLPEVFTITQEGLPRTINLTAGNLAWQLTTEEMKQITSLVITGTMDARDFKVIRDQMPWLMYLDITGVTITAYSGTDGTSYGNYNYKANAIPPNALYAEYDGNKSRLSRVLLPSTLTLIDRWAFNASRALTSIIIPPTVIAIGEFAFYSSQGLRTVIMAEGVDSIGYNAFSACFALTSISIPSSIKYIGGSAFSNLTNLDTIYSYATIPLNLSTSSSVFWEIDKDSCILYVPYGSKALYENADQWKDFTHIVEMPGFNLSATALSMEAIPAVETVKVNTEGKWMAACDKDWLSITPSLSEGQKEITLIAQNNEAITERVAIVTVSAPETDAKIIVVTQKGLATGVARMAQMRPLMSCYPNPFTENITIEIQNAQKEKVTVDIYNMAGQKVKNLTNGNRAEKITLSWDGINEKGQRVAPGVYMLKMNEEVRKVVKR